MTMPSSRYSGIAGLRPAEAALAALVLAHRLEQVLPAEVGPQDLGEDELAVRRLPQQEVRDARLTRRANDDVGVGHRRLVEVLVDQLLVDLVGADARPPDGLHGIDDLGPPAVVEGDG